MSGALLYKQGDFIMKKIICLFMLLLAYNINVMAQSTADDLVYAAENGDVRKIGELLSKGADINARNSDGQTALIMAMLENHSDVVNFLISKDVDVNTKNGEGKTPLMVASSKGYTEIAKILIAKGAYINAKDSNGETALTMACISDKNVEIVKALIAAKADVNIRYQSRYATTPLIEASYWGATEIVKELIAGGANVNDGVYDNGNDFFPLSRASARGYVEIVKALIAAGANVNATVFSSRTIGGEEMDISNTVLTEAILRGRTEVVRILIAAGANVNEAYTIINMNTMKVSKFSPLELAKDKPEITNLLRAAGAR